MLNRECASIINSRCKCAWSLWECSWDSWKCAWSKRECLFKCAWSKRECLSITHTQVCLEQERVSIYHSHPLSEVCLEQERVSICHSCLSITRVYLSLTPLACACIPHSACMCIYHPHPLSVYLSVTALPSLPAAVAKSGSVWFIVGKFGSV